MQDQLAIPTPQEQPTLSAEQTARALGVHKMTLYRLARTGKIESIQIGRSRRFSTALIRQMIGLDGGEAA